MNRYLTLFTLTTFLLLLTTPCFAENDDAEQEEKEVEPEEEKSAPEEENDVVILTDDNFDDFVEEHDLVLLEFYAPWCGHCKSFAPEYEKIAKTLKKEKIPVAKVDATAHSKSAAKYDVTGYPTVIILKKDQDHIKYDGARTEAALVAKMMELADPNWKPPPEAVYTLTTSNFDEFVNNEEITLVEFYAPWCGHCKQLAPEYEAAAQELKSRDTPIKLAKVDATAESELGKRFDVSGYPTLKVFRKGKEYEYKGGRDKRTIVSYMLEQNSPPSVALSDLKSTKNLLHQTADVVVVGFFTDKEDDEFVKYQDAATNMREDFTFRHTFDSSIAQYLKAQTGSIQVIQPERFQSKYEKSSYKLEVKEDTKPSEISDFINNKAVPLVGERTTKNSQKLYTKRPLVVVYYAVDFSFDYRKNTQIWREKVLKVAKEFKDVTFAISNEDQFSADLEKAGLADSGEEINVVAYDKDEKRYGMEPTDEFDEEVLTEFVKDFTAGKIKPKLKSAPIPKKNNGPVKIIVGKTFDEIVMDDSKDVMIEFYAPWCGHCKKLTPIYKSLGKKFKDNDDVIIAKMDATANDIPHSAFKVEGFPTIYWSSKSNKDNPTKYEGGRELEDMVKFINKEITQQKTEL